MAVVRLLPSPPSRVDGGRVVFDGADLVPMPEGAMRDVRGNRIGMVFQQPMPSLNPNFPVGFQIAEFLRLTRGLDRQAAPAKEPTVRTLVGFDSAERTAVQLTHQIYG